MQLKDSSLLRSESYVNGEWLAAPGGKTFPINNPATGELIMAVADHGADTIKTAIDAAAIAQKEWAGRTAKDRAMLMRAWFNLIMENQEDLAQILTAEMGKPLAEARGEIAYGASFIDWFGEEGRRISGDILQPHMTDKRIMVLKQPIGVFWRDYALEFPQCDDHPQISPRPCRGLRGGAEARGTNPAFSLGLGGLGGTRRHPQRRDQYRQWPGRAGHGAGIDQQPHCAQNHFHGVDRSWPHLDEAISGYDQKSQF